MEAGIGLGGDSGVLDDTRGGGAQAGLQWANSRASGEEAEAVRVRPSAP